MISRDKFEVMKERYGYWSSWAIWAAADEAPKSNVGDLSIFQGDKFLGTLNPEIVLVGLNISRGDIKYPLANFHDARAVATDFKIRYALKGTVFWGSYMTDIIKDYNEKESGKMMDYLRSHRDFEKQNAVVFQKELDDLGSVNPTLIAFGRDVYAILCRNFKHKYRILKIPHYASYSSQEIYREQVRSIAV